MLTLLTKGMRRRAAIVMGALYFLCSVGPAVSLTFADPQSASHCVTDNTHGVKAHSHDEAVAHTHGGDIPSDDQSSNKSQEHSGSCCGLFCVSGIPSGPVFVLTARVEASAPEVWPELQIAGNPPSRIDRPPITLMSL